MTSASPDFPQHNCVGIFIKWKKCKFKYLANLSCGKLFRIQWVEDKLCLSTPLVEKDYVEAANEQTSSVLLGRRTNLMASPIPKEVPRHNWWLEVPIHSCISNGVKMSQSPPQSSAWSPMMSRLPVQRGHPIAFENMGIPIRTQGRNCSVDGSSSEYPCLIPCHRWRPC